MHKKQDEESDAVEKVDEQKVTFFSFCRSASIKTKIKDKIPVILSKNTFTVGILIYMLCNLIETKKIALTS